MKFHNLGGNVRTKFDSIYAIIIYRSSKLYGIGPWWSLSERESVRERERERERERDVIDNDS